VIILYLLIMAANHKKQTNTMNEFVFSRVAKVTKPTHRVHV